MLQEILHRYIATGRRDAVGPARQVVLALVDEVLPIEKADVLRAADIAAGPAQLSARNALPVAVMERHGLHSILSFDADFDRRPGLTRVHEV